jgi:hypothetical protein
MWRGVLVAALCAACGGGPGAPRDAQPDGPVDALADAPTDAPIDAKAANGSACTGDGDCANGHCIANVPAGTGSTCCATSCATSDPCHVAQCSTGTCRDVDISTGACAVTAAGGQLSACGVAALGCTAPADTDGDNLPDAWETSDNGAGVPFVDFDCDGVWDPASEPLLSGASPTVPDIYVTYDYMGYGLDSTSCLTTSNCTAAGAYHADDTCDGTGQCRFICSQSSDCTDASRGPAHAAEQCLTIAAAAACPDAPGSPSGSCACHHTHDPEAIAPGALQKVIDVFALHGVSLHIVRGREQPHSNIVSFRSDAEMTLSCEGANIGAGTVGAGKYAASLYDLKSVPAASRTFVHYALFAHNSGCDATTHCPANPGNTSDCTNLGMRFGQAGLGELYGNDFVVSLGTTVNGGAFAPGITSTAGFSQVGATFMHELGHNLGIRHDGHVDRPCPDHTGCASDETCVALSDNEGLVCHETVGGLLGDEEPNYKPNYISIMNYRYELYGIQSSSTQNVAASGSAYTPGSDVPDPALTRLDFSNQALPTLHEDNLDDASGLGWTGDPLYLGAFLLFTYTDASCHVCSHTAPASGSVDWQCTDCATNPSCQLLGSGPAVFDSTGVAADVDTANGVCTATPADTLTGHKDWGNFVYSFQCSPSFD